MNMSAEHPNERDNTDWIEHVEEFAARHGLTYAQAEQALTDDYDARMEAHAEYRAELRHFFRTGDDEPRM